jgi:hypothetical protein
VQASERAEIELADARVAKLKQLVDLENSRRGEYNAHHPATQVPLIPEDAGQLEHDLDVYNVRQQAAAELAQMQRESQLELVKFNDLTAQASRSAAEELQDDPLQKNLQKVTDGWNRTIDAYEKGAAGVIKTLKQHGVDVTDLITKENATVMALLAARGKAEADQQRKNDIELMSGFTQPGKIQLPSVLFVSNEESETKGQAEELIKRISAALQDETAQEALLKDQAKTTGETQIDLESKLLALRTSTADNLQDLTTRLQQLGAAMHAGIGDPTVLSQADKLNQKIEALRQKTSTWDAELKQSLVQDMGNAFIGLADGADTVSQAFHNMLKSILQDLAKLIEQMYIVQLLQKAIGAIGGLFGGGGDGDVVDMSSQINLPSVISGQRASGGPVLPGMTYTVGEFGPEKLTMGSMGGYVTSNSNGAAAPIVNVHNYGSATEVKQQSHFDGQQWVTDVILRDLHNNGPIRGAITGM